MSEGSKWRRWEPHVHMPGTLFEDQFKSATTEQALDALAACTPSIEVVGITDYFTTASFRRAHDAWHSGAGAGITYLFPNVELRLNDATARGNGVNIHVLAAAEDVDLLDELLARLTFSLRDVDYPATDAGLVSLGRAHTGSASLEEGAARREGAKQFKVTFEQLKSLFQRDIRFRERCLVAVAAGSDGTSGMRSRDGGFAAYTKGLERFAHAIFSGNPRDRDFWVGLGSRSVAEIEVDYHSLKVCLHGSDAHQVGTLGKPDQNRYTWLKGDPDFDTLWQACLAPERRAHIGASNPLAGQFGRINAVTINDRSWFTQGTVPINTGLVAIVGPRGSGKTALADLVAVGAGSVQPFETEGAFVHRAAGLLGGSEVTVGWYQDDATTHALDGPDQDEGSSRVRYLSQQFVERLCASDGVRPELLREIERVIFEAWPVERRQGATSFDELLNIRLGSARHAQREELAAVTQACERITDQRVIKSGLKRKQEDRTLVGKTVVTLEDQIKELTGKADATSGERHGHLSRALAARQRQLQAADLRVTEVRSLQGAIVTARNTHFPAFLQRLRDPHQHVGITPQQWESFIPVFSGDVDGILATALTATQAEYNAIAGVALDPASAPSLDTVAVENLGARTIAELTREQSRVEQLVGLDRQRAANLTRFQQQLSAAQAAVAKLDEEISFAQQADERTAELILERTSRYESYFNALLGEEEELRQLYSPLEELLKNSGETVSKLKLSVKRRADLAAWVAQGEQLIDLRTAGPFRGTGGLKPIAEETLLRVWETGDGAEAAAAIQQFSQQHSSALREHSPASQTDEASYREWERGVARWLFNVGHIGVSYSLEYDGLNVERLSPGSRGIVLLLLYLAVDQSETDPLIIDQPEENLDPKSVYSELVSLFQVASERRQIIMVTHNANLVVNTDVDQVIVAHCDSLEEGKLPRLSYSAGGLESRAIRQAVCDVLEGGADAFRQRARRLHIDAPWGQEIDD